MKREVNLFRHRSNLHFRTPLPVLAGSHPGPALKALAEKFNRGRELTMFSKYVYGLSLGHFVVDFSQGALAALLPLLIAQHHFNYAIAATLVFAMNLVSSIIQPLFGFLSDRFRTDWIIIPALLITGLGFGTLGWDNQYFLLITSCLVCGVGIAAYHPDAAKLVNGLADVNQGHGPERFLLWW